MENTDPDFVHVSITTADGDVIGFDVALVLAYDEVSGLMEFAPEAAWIARQGPEREALIWAELAKLEFVRPQVPWAGAEE
jgi:hypothetical protein